MVITQDPDAARVITKNMARHYVPMAEVGEEARLNALSILFARCILKAVRPWQQSS
jgi:hypothetical protein